MHPLYNSTNLKEYRKKLRRDSTYSEKVLWQDLRNKKMYGVKFYRQFSIVPYIIDFYCSDVCLAIELDGISHTDPKVVQNDVEKTQFLELNGIKLLRFTDDELFRNYDKVLKMISDCVEKPQTPPTPSY